MTTPQEPTSTQHMPTPAAKQDRSYQAAIQPTTLAYTNTFALLAILFAFIAPLVGIIFGHIALKQIKRNGDAGRGIGLTGLIISYVFVGVIVLLLLIYVGLVLTLVGEMGSEFAHVMFDTSGF